MAAARKAATSATAVEWRNSLALGCRPRTSAAASTRDGTDIRSIVGSVHPEHRSLRWCPRLALPLCRDDKVASVCRDFDGPVQVGSVDRRSVTFEAGDRRRRWMSVVVIGADTHYGDLRLEYVEELVCGR